MGMEDVNNGTPKISMPDRFEAQVETIRNQTHQTVRTIDGEKQAKVSATLRTTSDRDFKTALAQAAEKVAKNRRNHTEELPRLNTVTTEDETKFKNDILQGKREEIGAY
eukprot:4473962-Amphidinium_carterae.1